MRRLRALWNVMRGRPTIYNVSFTGPVGLHASVCHLYAYIPLIEVPPPGGYALDIPANAVFNTWDIDEIRGPD